MCVEEKRADVLVETTVEGVIRGVWREWDKVFIFVVWNLFNPPFLAQELVENTIVFLLRRQSWYVRGTNCMLLV